MAYIRGCGLRESLGWFELFEKVDKSDDDPDDVDDGGMNPAEEAIVDLLEVEGMERLSEKVYFSISIYIFFSSIYHF